MLRKQNNCNWTRSIIYTYFDIVKYYVANNCSELQLKIARVMTKGTEYGVGNIMENVNMELVWQFTCNIVKMIY